MRISVIIPTFNRASLLPRAIDSALNQTLAPHEVIVVDDCSYDHTKYVLESYDNVDVLILPVQGGVSKARNFGIDKSSGEWIAFLDSDDEWLPRKLEAQAQYHTSNPDVSISQTDEIWIRGSKRVNAKQKHAKVGGWIFEELLPLCLISPSAVMIHRSVFDEIGTFDESFPVCEDYDLWLRIAKKYFVGFIPENLILKYGGRSDQLSKKYWGMDIWRVRAMEKHLQTLHEFNEAGYGQERIKQLILNELEYKSKIIANGAKKREKELLFNEYSEKAKHYGNLRSLTQTTL